MLWNYVRFDFGKSYFRDVTVIQLIKEKLPVSISLGIWMTLLDLPDLDSARHPQGGAGRLAFDMWTSGVIIVGYAIPGFLFAILLIILFAGGSFFQMFPLRGLTSDNWAQLPWWQKILDYFWHLVLPIISMGLAAFATMTLLTKNSFLDEIRKQYVLTARAKGCSERQVLYGHVFRNAMLLVIAGFPGAFVSAFFAGSLLIETIFSLDGLGLLGFESVLNRDYPVVFANALHFLAGRAGREPDLRPHLHLDRSAHRFRDAGGVRWTRARRAIRLASDTTPVRRSSDAAVPPRARARIALSPINQRRWQNFKANRRGYWSLWIFLVLFVVSLFAEFIANDKPFYVALRRPVYFPVFVTYPETTFGGDLRDRGRLSRPVSAEADRREGRLHDLAADPLFLRHPQSRSADAGAVEADLDADRDGMQAGGASARLCKAAATSNTTGSAPTIRAATCWRG